MENIYLLQKNERNRRLTKAVREHMAKERLNRVTTKMVQHVLDAPVNRGFFVSVDHLLVMERRRREGKLPVMTDTTAGMWNEIFDAFDDVRRKHRKISRTDAAAEVIARGQASRFFITLKNACHILRNQNITVEK